MKGKNWARLQVAGRLGPLRGLLDAQLRDLHAVHFNGLLAFLGSACNPQPSAFKLKVEG